MADLVVVPASVLASSGASKIPGTSGAAIIAGQTVYKGTDNLYYPADANGADPLYKVAGIALCSAPGVGQPFYFVAVDASFKPGFTTVAGKVYVASATAGGIAAIDDLASGWRTTFLGTGLAGNFMALNVSRSDTAVP